jgi:hypothetical protein
VKTTAAERVEEARELVPFALDDAAEGRKQRNPVAEAFPNLARAQYLDTYVDLDFVRVHRQEGVPATNPDCVRTRGAGLPQFGRVHLVPRVLWFYYCVLLLPS